MEGWIDKMKEICRLNFFQSIMVLLFGLVWFFTSQSTARVMSGRSVHLTTFFPWASLTKQLTSTSCTYFHLLLNITFLESTERMRMAVEIISWSISAKVLDWARIKLATPGSADRHLSAVRHIIHCTMRPGT